MYDLTVTIIKVVLPYNIDNMTFWDLKTESEAVLRTIYIDLLWLLGTCISECGSVESSIIDLIGIF